MPVTTHLSRPGQLEDLLPAASVGIRPSWRVKRVAVELDMDASQIRKLVKGRKLEGHIVGKRGVRIYVDSIIAYQEARPTGGALEAAPAKRRVKVNTVRARKMLDGLRALGCL